MRRVGIPVAAIIDLEALDDRRRTNWPRVLAACQVPSDRQAWLEAERAYIKGVIDGIADGHNRIKIEGVDIFGDADKQRATHLFDAYAAYGLFLVPVGELERWLKPMGGMKHGPPWVVDLFRRIGQDETDTDYVRPGNGDVWEFLDSIAAWLEDPTRLGVA